MGGGGGERRIFPLCVSCKFTVLIIYCARPPPSPPFNHQDVEELKSLDEDLDSLSAHIDYVQENIVELQNDLIAIDDSKVA